MLINNDSDWKKYEIRMKDLDSQWLMKDLYSQWAP